ncbi:MAG: tetratricopeptide repeat protein [Crocinitomicaceae bacterium]|nr:tetratricopeptide repeat protein [Crocinitomicaceae bacterium]
MNKILVAFCFFVPVCLFGQLTPDQLRTIDSLDQVLSETETDTVLVKAWKLWASTIDNSDPQKSLSLHQKIDSVCLAKLSEESIPSDQKFFKEYHYNACNDMGRIYLQNGDYEKAEELFVKSIQGHQAMGYQKGVAISLSNLGNVYKNQNEYEQAIEAYEQSHAISTAIGFHSGAVNTLLNLGTVYSQMGQYEMAIEHYKSCQLEYEKMDDQRGIANCLNNIGIIYKAQDDYDNAIKYYEESLEIRLGLDIPFDVGVSYLNLGTIYDLQAQHEKGIAYFNKAMTQFDSIGFQKGIAICYANIGNAHINQETHEQALEFLLKSLEIYEQIGDKTGLSYCNTTLARLYIRFDQNQKAVDHAQVGLDMALEFGGIWEAKKAYRYLWKAHKNLGHYKKALEMHELYTEYEDSLQNESIKESIIESELKYEYDKQHFADSLEFLRQQEVSELEYTISLEQEAKQRYVLYGGLGFFFVLGGFVYRGYRRKKKDNEIIKKQKQLVEEKNDEILDSITYAKRIQVAILPPNNLIKQSLPDSFVLYIPKDIVAGDFYWFEKQDDRVFFAAADCTGHGVPGAMVSVVCNNGLNRSVREYGLTDPGKILDKTRELVIGEFEKSEEEVKDGMDIALCSLRLRSDYNEQIEKSKVESNRGLSGVEVHYAGAHNPLWIIRKGTQEIEEIKADKQPIGKFDTPIPYTTHTVQLNKGDSIYMFSDGYVDQFGGEKGKKFKSKNLKNLLLSIQNESMEVQKELIHKAFEDWRGSLDQIDDVCVIGVRI